jgi:hypothetical protein
MIVASAAVSGLTAVLSDFYEIQFPSFFWLTLPLLFLATSLIYRRLYHSNRSQFVMVYMLTLVLKVLGYLAYMVVIMLLDSSGGVANVLFFLALYFTYTAIEIALLYPRISRR